MDTLLEENIYTLSMNYPEIYLEKIGKQWYFSDHTAKAIPALHEAIYPFGIDRLMNLLPKMGTKKVLGLRLWQYIGILALIVICVILQQLFFLIFEKLIIGFLIKKGYGKIAKKFVVPVARPGSLLMLFPVLYLLIPVLQLPTALTGWILLILKVIWPVFATIIFYRLADLVGFMFMKFAEKTENTLDDQLMPLVRKTLKVFVVIVGGLLILANLDIDIIPLLTGLSIGGLAFALAAQDTIKNFFGSLMIFSDRPFQVGDWITSGSIDGTVEEVGFRATRIRTFRDSLTYVPNGFIANATVDNHGLRQYRRFYTQISINYDTPAEVIDVFVEGLRTIVEEHPHTRKDKYHVFLNEMADSSLNVMFYIFFKVPSWGEELRCKHEVLIEIIKLAEELGVSFAFPTRTLHMETFPEKKSLSPEYTKGTTALKNKLKSYLSREKEWNEGP
jgi:MscS family membrane protein